MKVLPEKWSVVLTLFVSGQHAINMTSRTPTLSHVFLQTKPRDTVLTRFALPLWFLFMGWWAASEGGGFVWLMEGGHRVNIPRVVFLSLGWWALRLGGGVGVGVRTPSCNHTCDSSSKGYLSSNIWDVNCYFKLFFIWNMHWHVETSLCTSQWQGG